MKKKWWWILLVVLVIALVVGISDDVSGDMVESLLFIAGSVVSALFFILVLIVIIALYKKRKSKWKKVGPTKTEETSLEDKKESWKKTKKLMNTSGGFVFIFVGWLVFVATIYYLHPNLWDVWYGDQPLFWISQASFVLVFAVFNKAKSLFYLLLVVAVSVSLWTGFKDELTRKGLIDKPKDEATILHPTRKKWKVCWQETNLAKMDPTLSGVPCVKNSKLPDMIADIKEINSIRFVFSVSWKERGVFKERSPFVWDKITNPNNGTWHQDGSTTRKDRGHWYLEQVNNGLFMGWITSNNTGKTYILSLRAL